MLKPTRKNLTNCVGLLIVMLGFACGGSSAAITECEPEGSCECTDGTERATLCRCLGGSNCSVEGNNIEFNCQGNAACGLSCGNNCLITCPGTTSCTVDTGDEAEIVCPGTASCDITCRANCTVDVRGTANAMVRCLAHDQGAVCTVTSCQATDCGDGVQVCRTSCPEEE